MPEIQKTFWGEFPIGDVMIRVCAWCGDFLGERESSGVGRCTHGICEECMRRETGNGGE